jgi:hypothetical protein
MRDADAFQLYLLSKMSARDLVNRERKKLGLKHDRMLRAASEVAAMYGLDEIVHPADIYDRLAGPAVASRELEPQEVSASFRGSTRRCYALPLWPTVLFVVNRHPSGYAWGMRFQQSDRPTREPDPCALVERVRPWSFASDALLSAASRAETLDEWTDYLESRLTFTSPSGSPSAWIARFDVGLLQIWERDPQRL